MPEPVSSLRFRGKRMYLNDFPGHRRVRSLHGTVAIHDSGEGGEGATLT